jgi:histidinol-phosphatase (PHP family)
MAAELSSSGWRKPVGEQYPAQGLLERFVSRDVPLTTASDAHHLDHVAYRADDLRALLASVGVDELRGYRARAPHAVPVAPPPTGTGSRTAERSGV